MALQDQSTYTKLLVYRSRQVLLGMIIAITVISFAFFIKDGIDHERHWMVIGFPLCLIGLSFILIPRTEAWEYKPWQSRPRKVEIYVNEADI